MPDFSCVLWDLDGTIVDSAPGIIASLDYTYEQLGLTVPPFDEMLAWVGPPILDSFRDLAGLDADESIRALAIYREHYITHGAAHSPVFPGMPEVLKAVHDSGLPTSLATSKPEVPATLILESAHLTPYIDIITGASADEVRSAKKDVVAEALRRLSARGADISHAVLVGDRHHDVDGATANGIPTIAVEWGYGSPAEHAKALTSVATPVALQRLLIGS